MKYLLIFVTLVTFTAKAQENQNDARELVMYDPLFWKSDLSLRDEQSKKIEEINAEFYQNLRQIKEETPDRESNTTRLEQGLHERSQKIYQTLMPRQRKKLEKIIDKTSPVPAP